MERMIMINKILTALAACLADQYGETVTAGISDLQKPSSEPQG